MNADSNREWVARTPLRFAENVADLRRIRGLDVLVDGDVLWLRGDDGAGDLSDRIRSIPDAELFERQPGEQLTRSGETVPCAHASGGLATDCAVGRATTAAFRLFRNRPRQSEFETRSVNHANRGQSS